MFKKLRGMVEDAKQSPLRMPSMNVALPGITALGAKNQANPENKPSCSTLSEENQFSITEDDGTSSEMGSPQKAGGFEENSKPDLDSSNDQFLFAFTETQQHSSYIPPSDLESEVEDPNQTPPTSLDDSISKEQLFFALQRLHARVQKYKTKYSKVALACKEANSEKEKIMRTLSDNQDRALRRLNELKEQCSLEQQAKAHLEENLRVILEEKDQMISVLETKVNLLKEGQSPDPAEETNSEAVSEPEKENSSDILDLQRKSKRLEELLTRCKDALRSNKERSSQLTVERDQLANQLEQKELELQKVQEHEGALQARLRGDLATSEQTLSELRKGQEESAMTMAETKRSFHEELEVREQKLSQTRDQLSALKDDMTSLQKQFDKQSEEYQALEQKLQITTTSLESEKDDLVAELSRGKTAALDLLRETHQNQIVAIEEEWKTKYEILQQNVDDLKAKVEHYEQENAREDEKLVQKQKSLEEALLKQSEAKASSDVELQNMRTQLDLSKEQEQSLSRFRELNSSLEEELKKLSDEKCQLKGFQESLEFELKKSQENESNASQKIAELGEQISALKVENELFLSEKMSMLEEMESLKQRLVDVDRIKEISESKEAVVLELQRISQSSNSLEEKIKLLEASISSKDEELAETNQLRNSLIDENSSLKAALQSQETELQHISQSSNSFEEKIKSLEAAISSKDEELAETIQLRNALTDENSSLKAALQSQETETESLKMSLTSNDTELVTANRRKASLEAENSSLKTALQLDEKEMFSMKADLDESRSQLRSFKQAFLSRAKDLLTQNSSFDVSSLSSLTLSQSIVTTFEILKVERQKQLDEIVKYESLLNERDRTLSELKAASDALETECKENSDVAVKIDELNLRLSNSQVMIEEKDVIINKLEENISGLNLHISELQSMSERNTQLAEEMQLTIEAKTHICDEKSQTVMELNDKLGELRDCVADLNEKLHKMQKIEEELQLQLAERTFQLEKAHGELEASQHDLGNARVELQKAEVEKAEKEQLRLDCEQQVFQQIKDLNSMINAKSEEVRNLEIQHHEYEIKLAEARDEKSLNESQLGLIMENRLSERETLIETLKQHSKRLEEEISDLKIYQQDKLALQNEEASLRGEIQGKELVIEQFNEQLDLLENGIELVLGETSTNSIHPCEQFKALENNSTKMNQLISKISFHVEYLKKLNRVCDNLLTRVNSSESEREKLSSYMSKLTLEKDEKDRIVQEVHPKLMALEEEVPTLRSRVLELEINNKAYQAQNQDLEVEISRLKEQISKMKNKLKEQLKKSKLFEEKCGTLETDIAQFRTELSNTQEEGSVRQASLTDEINVLRSQKEHLLSQVETVNSEKCMDVSKFKEQQSELETKCLQLEKSLSEQIRALEDAENKYLVAQNITSQINDARTQLQERCGELETELSGYSDMKGKLEILQSENAQIKNELREKNVLLKELKKEMEFNADVTRNLTREFENLKTEFAGMNTIKDEVEVLLKGQLGSAAEAMELLKQELTEEKSKHAAELVDLNEIHQLKLAELQTELKVRDSQLDESLFVAEANSSDIVQGLELTKSELTSVSQENEELKSKLIDIESQYKDLRDEFETSKKTFEEEKKEKAEDVEVRLKQLVKDFSLQMHQKEEEHEKTLTETIEKYHGLEHKLEWNKENVLTTLEKKLIEQSVAMEEMREHFLLEIKEKDELIAKLMPQGTKGSDWDNAWEEEPDVDPDSIKGYKIEDLQASVNNYEKENTNLRNSINFSNNSSDNNHVSTLGAVLEPTEFEYLRNILMEYMMGKEPLTLAKVIAAVLRFPEQQTNEILQREEARSAATV